jgi:hypothetical protein
VIFKAISADNHLFMVVLDIKSQNIPEVVVVRRGAGGILGR